MKKFISKINADDFAGIEFGFSTIELDGNNAYSAINPLM